MRVIKSIDDALATVGEELGVSRWVEIDQSRIDAHTVEIDGVDKPAAVAELIARFVW